jgi:hypothetical protein
MCVGFLACTLEHGSNPYNMAVLVEYANADGDVVQVDMMMES